MLDYKGFEMKPGKKTKNKFKKVLDRLQQDVIFYKSCR